MDLYAPGGDLQFPLRLVKDNERYEQAARILFRTLVGEFVLNKDVGIVPLKRNRDKLNYNNSILKRLIENTLKGSPLFKLKSFSMSKDVNEYTISIYLIIVETNEDIQINVPMPTHINYAGHTFVTRR